MKNWLIKLLGGYTREEVKCVMDAWYDVRNDAEERYEKEADKHARATEHIKRLESEKKGMIEHSTAVIRSQGEALGKARAEIDELRFKLSEMSKLRGQYLNETPYIVVTHQ